MAIYRSALVLTAFQISSHDVANTLYSIQWIIYSNNKDFIFANGSNYNNLTTLPSFDTEIAFGPLV
jgi:hypothetical protein